MSILGGTSDFFGLDIGAQSLRIVKLNGGGESFSIDAFGSTKVESSLTASDARDDMIQLSKIIKELVKKTGIETKNVVVAVPGTSVFNAVINLPNMSQSELSKAIIYQAEQNIPLKLTEIKYDWQVVGKNPQTNELIVMIIAAAKGKVESISKLLSFADLNVVAMETAAVALSRSLSTNQEKLAMILDIGANNTEIAIIANNMLSLTRSVPLGGNALSRAIVQGLRLEAEQAETFKTKFGLSHDKLEGQVFKAIEPVIKNILDEAVRSQKYYQETFGLNVQRLILTGGSSRLPLLAEYIKSYMNVEVLFGNPWSKVSFPDSYSEKLNQIAPEFATAVGLAMRGE